MSKISERIQKVIKERISEIDTCFDFRMTGSKILVKNIYISADDLTTESGILLPSDSIIDPSGAAIRSDERKANEAKAENLVSQSTNHPFVSIIVAIGSKGEEEGLKVGDILYTGESTFMSRDIIKHEGVVFHVSYIDRVYCVVGNKKLDKKHNLNLQ